MDQSIFVVNAGSSSIKFKLYRVLGDDIEIALGGAFDGIGSKPRFKAKDRSGKVLVERAFSAAEVSTSAQAQHVVADWLRTQISDSAIAGVGHRVVHGGSVYSQPVVVDDGVLATLEAIVPLAPLHQPSNLDPIRVLRNRHPDLPQVACFDTAFHRGHPELSDRLALPHALYDEGIRRYGFHGLSYEYVAAALRKIAPDVASGRVVIAHLGSGASACGLRDGRSIDSTMSFTALDGLPMGTRSGSIDPGVVLHLIEQKRMTPAQVERILYHESGLFGLSGISSDVRDLLTSESRDAAMAIDFFCLHVAQEIAKLTVSIGGLDGLVFTAGIGENAPQVRRRVLEHLSWSGLSLDAAANQRNTTLIAAPGSKAKIFVIPTDEERMIGLHTLRLLKQPETAQHSAAHV